MLKITVWTDFSSFKKILDSTQHISVRHVDRSVLTWRISVLVPFTYTCSLHLVNHELLRESNRNLNIGARSDLLKYEVD